MRPTGGWAAALMVGAGDNSGLTPGVDTVSLSPTDIVYGAGTGPSALPGSGLTKSWTGDIGDVFVETLTAVDSIDRLTPDQVIVDLSGTVSDSQRLFVDTLYCRGRVWTFADLRRVVRRVTLDLMHQQSMPVLMSHYPFGGLHIPGIRRRNTSELDRVAATSMANVRAQMP